MFYSEYSGKLFGPGISPVTIVIEKRPKEYQNEVRKKIRVTYGFEIVKEIKVAPNEVQEVYTKYNLGEIKWLF